MEGHILSSTNPDYEAVLKVLLQLRPRYNLESLSEQVQKQQRTGGYQVIYVKSDAGDVLAVAGFRMDEKLAWGKHIYIDDLVTNSKHRSTGVGRYLMNWFKGYAMDNDCREIHLDSSIQRSSAHKFYLREDFEITSYHFSMNYKGRAESILDVVDNPELESYINDVKEIADKFEEDNAK